MAGRRRRLRGAERRLLKGYAPLVVLVAALVAMVAVVPSKVPADLAAAGRGEATEVSAGQPATGWNETVTACPDRPVQVPDLGYSPPCFAFAGDNGGDDRAGRHRRHDPGQLPRHLRPQPAAAPRPARRRAARRVERGDVPDDGGAGRVLQRQLPVLRPQARAGPLRRAAGQILPEFTGGGQDAATNDSIKVANEIGAFADITGITQPYADALARNEVIAVGRPLHVARVVRGSAARTRGASSPTARSRPRRRPSYANSRLFGRTADHAGGDLADQHRTLAVIAPNNLEYQQCVDSFEAQIGADGQRGRRCGSTTPSTWPSSRPRPPASWPSSRTRAPRRCRAPATRSCRCTWPQEADRHRATTPSG